MLSVGSLFTYWVLKILLIGILIFCGYGISYKYSQNFKIYAIIATIFYSLIQGLRWNRGIDYLHYYHDLVDHWETPDPEFLYKTIVSIVSVVLGLPYWCGFILYSFVLIFAVLLVFKIYPKAAVWGLPLFFLVTESSSENLIRQYLAISFIIFAYYAYLKKKKILTAIFLCCVPMIHISGWIAVFVFILLAFFRMPLKKPWLLLGIYIILFFLWDVSYFNGIAGYLPNYHLGKEMKMQGYWDNSSRWFSEEGSINNVLGKNNVASLPNILLNFLSQLVIIYYGFKAQLNDHKLQVAYYFAYIAILFHVTGGDIEMYRRFYNWFIYLMPFVLGVAMYEVPMKKFEKYSVMTILLVNYLLYGVFQIIHHIPYSGFAFVWDR